MKPKQFAFVFVLAAALVPSANAQQSIWSGDRLKINRSSDGPIDAKDGILSVSGIWVPESKDPAKALIFPQQVKITCTRRDKICKQLTVTLGVIPETVFLMSIEEDEYDIDSWDAHGLVASSGGLLPWSCQRKVLTIGFTSGRVSVSDIPTHKKGCELVKETDSYKLVHGNYYVDTSPGNDIDKQKK